MVIELYIQLQLIYYVVSGTSRRERERELTDTNVLRSFTRVGRERLEPSASTVGRDHC
jgi:hypothetical protein